MNRPGDLSTRTRQFFRIAGHSVAIDPSHSLLESLRTGHHEIQSPPPSSTPVDTFFDGNGWVAGKWHAVRCAKRAHNYAIDIADVADFLISGDGTGIEVLAPGSNACSDAIAHAALGPPLVFALALAGKYCLHGSAVGDESRMVAFMGPSGAGKSTLARLLHQHPETAWRRAGDDILAVSVQQPQVTAFPHFPQLKLPADDQPWHHFGEQQTLDVVYALEPASRATEVRSQRMRSSDAVLALLSRTVAARLFPPAMKEKHLDFCTSMAQQVPVFRLSYPHRLDAIPEIQRTIERDLVSS